MGADLSGEHQVPLVVLMHRAARAASEEFATRLADQGVGAVTPAHTTVLEHLADGGTLTIAELARRAGVTRQTMHRSVTQLVDEGLLATTPGTGFPRSTLVGLTAAGMRRRDVALEVFRAMDDALAERLGAQAVAGLRDTLARAWPE